MKSIRTVEKVISVWAWLILMIFVSSTASVLADQDEDDTPNYGVRGNRITSDCVINGGILVIPQVPPPPTLVSPCSLQGLVTTLDTSPNSRWSVDINWFDPTTQKLYLADRNNFGVDIFDTKSEKAVGLARWICWPPTDHPQRFVAPAVANNRGPMGVG